MENPNEETNHNPKTTYASSVTFPLVKSADSLILLQGYVPTEFGS